MTAAEGAARNELKTLSSAWSRPGSRAQLDRRLQLPSTGSSELNAQLIALSRRNTNVRSLALSLGQKRMLTATCEDSLRALQDALGKRGFSATR